MTVVAVKLSYKRTSLPHLPSSLPSFGTGCAVLSCCEKAFVEVSTASLPNNSQPIRCALSIVSTYVDTTTTAPTNIIPLDLPLRRFDHVDQVLRLRAVVVDDCRIGNNNVVHRTYSAPP